MDEHQRRAAIEAYFIEANRSGEPTTTTSPSGRYRLVVSYYKTPPSGWGYSRGIVTRIADGTVVGDVKRNLTMFHHTFVTKADREYLIAGRSYMSQTIIDLDAGVEYEPSGSQYQSHGFCWAQCYLSPDGNTLAVDGCVWAGPYELRFFDFTDPAAGWPALDLAGASSIEAPSDLTPPRWLDAVTFECHQVDEAGAPQERTRLERRGASMVVINHWVSDAEQARRDEECRLDAEQDAWWDDFSTHNPLYLRLLELTRIHKLPTDTLLWRPGAHRIVQYFRRTNPRASADFTWDVDDATIAVQRYDSSGNTADLLSFPATLAGLDDALAIIAAAFAR